IIEAGAVDIFDAYLQLACSQEDASLAKAIFQEDWVRDVLSHASQALGLTELPSPEKIATPSPKAKAPTQIPMSFLAQATESSLPRIPRSLEYGGTVWVPRILWALEFARRSQLGPLTAADIARILSSEGE